MTDILEKDRYAGTLTVGGHALPLGFQLSAGADGRLVFEPEPMDPRHYVQVVRAGGRPGQEREQFHLYAESPTGKSVSSESVYLLGHGSGAEGLTVNFGANVATVTLPRLKPVARPCLQLWLRSFRSFRNSLIKAPLGDVAVYGADRPETQDSLSGSLVVQAATGSPGPTWREDADGLLKHLHQGMALAHGGRLQVPIVEYASGDLTEAKFYAGRGSAAEFAVFPYLNHGPFIQALADRFFDKGPLPETLWTAMVWMHAETTFDEIRFFTGMTALEAIIESQLGERRGTIIPKQTFAPLRSAIDQVIDGADGLSKEAMAILKGRIAGINSKSFGEKIDALFDEYGISRADFDGPTIVGLVRLRNEIVHRGTIPGDSSIWPQIILVRELITRILLSEIDFVGHYDCYISGRHMRAFPECVPIPG